MSLEQNLKEYTNFTREVEFLNSVLQQPSHVNVNMVDVYTIGLIDISKRYSLSLDHLKAYYVARFGEPQYNSNVK